MDLIAEIRRRHLVSKESISSIARDLKLSRPTVRKHCRTRDEPRYQRRQQPTPMLGAFQETLEAWLHTERTLPKAQRRTARRLFEGLQGEGYRGAYDSVQRFVRRWKADKLGPTVGQAFVPLAFAPGEVCQFDWSHEHVELGGAMQTIKVAHFRLTFSRQMFVVAYPRETQEMVFDAHNRAFAFFGGVPQRMVYDNLKAVVEAIFTGKERQFNRRFMVLANHYLFEPVACTPASGWEKGQVENQVGNIREWLFTPLARFANFEALNEWLATRCRELAARKHPVTSARTIAACFAEEQHSLRPITAAFDGYVEHMLRASNTELLPQPLAEIAQPPAHHAMDRRDRAAVDLRGQCLAMRLGQPRRRARRLAVAQPIRPLGVEPRHPVPRTLQRDVAEPRRLRAPATIVDRRQGQQPPGLSSLLAAPRQAAKDGGVKISTKGNRARHGEPPKDHQHESHHRRVGESHS